MSARLGNPSQLTIAVASLGVSTGRVIPLNNPGWLVLVSGFFLYSTTATAGNRVVSFDFRDASNTALYRATTGSNITATQAMRVNIGAGVPTISSIAAPPSQYISTPDGFSLPPNSTLTVVDTANVDTADTVLGALIFSN